MDRRHFATLALGATALASGGGVANAAAVPTEWDGLVRVTSKRLKYVYLLPGADFRAYTKVILGPTQIAFRKDWQRNYNSTVMGLSGRVTDADVQQAIVYGTKMAGDAFAAAFAAGGYPLVNDPASDVLVIASAIINLQVTSPDTRSAGRSQTFSSVAGAATMVVEARDSMTNALLGRAIDPQVAGDTGGMFPRNRMTNQNDFGALAKTWATASVNGLSELKRLSPIAG